MNAIALSTIAKISPALASDLARGETREWGVIDGSHGRIKVRQYSKWVCGPHETEVLLDGAPVWRNGIGWLSREQSLEEQAARRTALRAAQRKRDEDRAEILRAIKSKEPVRYQEGQVGGYFWLGDAEASARGVFKAIEGRDPQSFWGPEWDAWVNDIVEGAPMARLPRRAMRDPVEFDCVLAG